MTNTNKFLAALILVATLSGCLVDTEPVDPYALKDKDNGGLGRWCRNTVYYTNTYVDSTTNCGEDAVNRFAKAEWLSKNGDCGSIDIEDVVGGLSGIRRYFTCQKIWRIK